MRSAESACLSLVGVVAVDRCMSSGDAFMVLGLLIMEIASMLVPVMVDSRWTRLTVFQNSVLCRNFASQCSGVILGSLVKVKVTFLQVTLFPASYKPPFCWEGIFADLAFSIRS